MRLPDRMEKICLIIWFDKSHVRLEMNIFRSCLELFCASLNSLLLLIDFEFILPFTWWRQAFQYLDMWVVQTRPNTIKYLWVLIFMRSEKACQVSHRVAQKHTDGTPTMGTRKRLLHVSSTGVSYICDCFNEAGIKTVKHASVKKSCSQHIPNVQDIHPLRQGNGKEKYFWLREGGWKHYTACSPALYPASARLRSPSK